MIMISCVGIIVLQISNYEIMPFCFHVLCTKSTHLHTYLLLQFIVFCIDYCGHVLEGYSVHKCVCCCVTCVGGVAQWWNAGL